VAPADGRACRVITSLVWLGARRNSNPKSGTGWKGWITSDGRRRCSTWTCWRNAARCSANPTPRQLAGKLRELRFFCGGQRVCISYWIAPGRRIIMLTVFTKTRMRETAEIERAKAAMVRCQREGHTPDDDEEG
jgi:hypothetical protein